MFLNQDEKINNVPATVKSHIDESALSGYTDDAVDLKTKPSVSGGYAIDVGASLPGYSVSYSPLIVLVIISLQFATIKFPCTSTEK